MEPWIGGQDARLQILQGLVWFQLTGGKDIVEAVPGFRVFRGMESAVEKRRLLGSPYTGPLPKLMVATAKTAVRR